MSDLILAIDQGTTGTTALLLDSQLRVVGKETVEFPQHFPKEAWVEHDLNEIWHSVLESVRRCLENSRVSPKKIIAIGITNQRETTCVWKRDEVGTPICNAIVWQDRRTADECSKLKARKLEPLIRKKTGLLLDPYFSATKLSWILKNVPGASSLAKSGKIAFGTIDSFLLYRFTGEHRTDPSNASRTLLMNLQKCEWDEDLLKIFKIPRSLLPQIMNSSETYGTLKNFPYLPDGIPVTGIAGDQQAALFGQACFKRGLAKTTYGTGAFILTNVGTKPVFSKHRLLTSVAWKFGGETTYCLEGSAFIAGASVQWLRDGLGIIANASVIETLACEVPDSGGVVFIPALSGLGAPHWLANARGLILGITRGTTRAHLARATLEGIAFQVQELVHAMEKDLGSRVKTLRVDGGACANNLLMQTQADLLGVPIQRAKVLETTALGAGLQAGMGVGLWKNFSEIEKYWRSDQEFKPQMSSKQRTEFLAKWEIAVESLKKWVALKESH